jgi:hypothetical protein
MTVRIRAYVLQRAQCHTACCGVFVALLCAAVLVAHPAPAAAQQLRGSTAPPMPVLRGGAVRGSAPKPYRAPTAQPAGGNASAARAAKPLAVPKPAPVGSAGRLPTATGQAAHASAPHATPVSEPVAAPLPTAGLPLLPSTETAIGGDPSGSMQNTPTAAGSTESRRGPQVTEPAPGHVETHTAWAGPMDRIAEVGQASSGDSLHGPDANQLASGGTGFIPKTAADDSAAAFRYGRLDAQSCLAEAARRNLPFVRVDSARGTLAPLRITGPIRGVAVHSPVPAAQRSTSVFEIIDCRLLLAIDDLITVTAAHQIAEIVHMSVYRPPYRGFPDGKQGARHEGALAIDIGHFTKRDGTRLTVDTDYHGFIGQKPCGTGTGPLVHTPASDELRQLTCEVLEARIFSVFLTPKSAPTRAVSTFVDSGGDGAR